MRISPAFSYVCLAACVAAAPVEQTTEAGIFDLGQKLGPVGGVIHIADETIDVILREIRFLDCLLPDPDYDGFPGANSPTLTPVCKKKNSKKAGHQTVICKRTSSNKPTLKDLISNLIDGALNAFGAGFHLLDKVADPFLQLIPILGCHIPDPDYDGLPGSKGRKLYKVQQSK
ncbi:hypothetical protein PWT90_01978 [Aphanocladium album]|nr:hypothetical protein PWT90_01978 [Aphanocladium album]